MNILKSIVPTAESSDDVKQLSIARSALFLLREEVHSFLRCTKELCQHMVAIGEQFSLAVGVSDDILGQDGDAAACTYSRGAELVERSLSALEAGIQLKVLTPLDRALGPVFDNTTKLKKKSQSSGSPVTRKNFLGHLNMGPKGDNAKHKSKDAFSKEQVYTRAPGASGSLEEHLDNHRHELLAVMRDMRCLQVAFLEAAAYGLTETALDFSYGTMDPTRSDSIALSIPKEISRSHFKSESNVAVDSNEENQSQGFSGESTQSDQPWHAFQEESSSISPSSWGPVTSWEGPIRWQSHIPYLPGPVVSSNFKSIALNDSSCMSTNERSPKRRHSASSQLSSLITTHTPLYEVKTRRNTLDAIFDTAHFSIPNDTVHSLDTEALRLLSSNEVLGGQVDMQSVLDESKVVDNVKLLGKRPTQLGLVSPPDPTMLRSLITKFLASSAPYLSIVDLCISKCVCKKWESILSASVSLFRCCIRGPRALPPHSRAGFYIHILYDRPAWLGRVPYRGKARAKKLGPVRGLYESLTFQALAIAETALIDGDGLGCSDNDRAGQHEQLLATSFKIIEADLERTRPALLLARSGACMENEYISSEMKEELMVTTGEMRERLRRVLRAFAVRSRRVTYCQGMNFVALALLEAAGGNEETAFWALSGLSEKLAMEGVWSPGLHRLEFALFALDHMLWQYVPDLAEHFVNSGISVGMFASKWFITLFQCHDTFGKMAAARILDIFVCESWPALLRIAIMVLIELAPQLLLLDLEGILHVMRFPRSILFGTYAHDRHPGKAAAAAVGADSLCERMRAEILLERAHALPFDVSVLRELEAEFYLGGQKDSYES